MIKEDYFKKVLSMYFEEIIEQHDAYCIDPKKIPYCNTSANTDCDKCKRIYYNEQYMEMLNKYRSCE